MNGREERIADTLRRLGTPREWRDAFLAVTGGLVLISLVVLLFSIIEGALYP